MENEKCYQMFSQINKSLLFICFILVIYLFQVTNVFMDLDLVNYNNSA